MNILSKIFGPSRKDLRQQLQRSRRRNAAITAANTGRGGRDGGWQGIPAEEDALNKEYLHSLTEVMQRSQDLDVNNPDVHGFHRTRVAQVVGKGVFFKATPRPSEISLDPDATVELSGKINRLRQLHSHLGGFDASGNNRSEGKQQERAVLTAFIAGSCLIHRVWRTDTGLRAMLPFSIELISGSRISTPYDRAGDPKISYGVEYSDTHRTRVVGYHVRRVSETRGNSFVPDYKWDFVPIVDGSLLSLTEMAGLDRSMPLSLSVVRMLRNRGEFIESAVESARAQASYYGSLESAPGQDAFASAQDDSDEVSNSGTQFTKLGGGVQMLYLQNGEKVNWNSARLPDPDFPGFMKVTDARCARGFVSSLSRFTREVTSSWAGGRLEDQQDDPIIDQYRESFVSAWRRVNEWFLECLWLTGALPLPGYSDTTRAYWAECHAEFPGKLHINPVDTMAAREKGYMCRTLTPQQACEEDGKDLRENLRQWGEAMSLVAAAEKEFGLEPETLTFLVSGKTISTSAGDDIGAPAPVLEPQPGTNTNRIREFLNQMRERQ